MEKIAIGQAEKLTSPAPFGLLSTVKEDGSANLMAISWWTYLSNHPATVGVCLSSKGLSHSLIEKNGEFTLNIVGEELKESALKCGTCSGKTVNKPEEFGIELCSSEAVAAPSVKGSRVVFECRLVDSVPAGDHIFYIAEVINAFGDADVKHLYAFDGYGRLDTVG